ncbi:hypothetical protein ACFFX0_17895 [Citricoccus parietis]|uniref:Uncharacterized protein n=1 Tax=Citricoccus parietis TaxID=592307 RepID=A0ABV5G3D0_9MICC
MTDGGQEPVPADLVARLAQQPDQDLRERVGTDARDTAPQHQPLLQRAVGEGYPSQDQPCQEGHTPHQHRVGAGEEDPVEQVGRIVAQVRVSELEDGPGGQLHSDPDHGPHGQQDPRQGGDDRRRSLQQRQGQQEQHPVHGQDDADIMAEFLQGQTAGEQQRGAPQDRPPRQPPTGPAGGPGQEGHPHPGQHHEQDGGPPHRQVVHESRHPRFTPGTHVHRDHADDGQRPGRVETRQAHAGRRRRRGGTRGGRRVGWGHESHSVLCGGGGGGGRGQCRDGDWMTCPVTAQTAHRQDR